MRRQDRKGDDRAGMVPITVRFTEGAMNVINELATVNKQSKADIIRLAVDNRLEHYLSKVFFIDHEDAERFHKELYRLMKMLEEIRAELHRIGVNYNQELKLQNIKNKYAEKMRTQSMSYDLIVNRQREEEDILKDSQNLNKRELSDLMQKYEAVTQKVGEVVCRILG